MKKTIRLKENELHKVIRESVKRILRETLEPGTVSHGTMRNQDVLPKIMSQLFKEDPQRAREIWNGNEKFLEALCDERCGIENSWWDSEEATQMSEELFDIMNEYVPEGHYFGAHPGDGSDYGVWANED